MENNKKISYLSETKELIKLYIKFLKENEKEILELLEKIEKQKTIIKNNKKINKQQRTFDPQAINFYTDTEKNK